MREIAFVAALALLSACGSVPSPAPEPAPPPKPITIPCVKASDWPKDDQTALADALAHIIGIPIIARLVIDWQRMRDEAVACKAAQSHAGQ